MPDGDYQKFFKAGDRAKFAAATINRWQRAATVNERRDHSATTPLSDPGLVLVKNNSGSQRQWGEVLGLDGPLISAADNFDEFRNTIAFKGIVPVSPTHFGRWGVCEEPIADGAVGLLRVSGLCRCAVKISLSATTDTCVGIGPGGDATKLYTGKTGRGQLLAYDTDGTGQKWAYISIATNPKWKDCA